MFLTEPLYGPVRCDVDLQIFVCLRMTSDEDDGQVVGDPGRPYTGASRQIDNSTLISVRRQLFQDHGTNGVYT